jgi:[acyl-carrier-protein] S-malonyltransferase
VSLACLRVLRDETGIEAGAVAGHSLGEYAALCAAGAMSFADTMSVVQTRGAAMRAEAERHPGSMAAIFALPPDVIAAVCEEVGSDQVQIANMNAPGQVAITGTVDGVQQAGKLAKTKGAKLVVPLKVSGPWHSRFMAGAQEPVAAALERTALAPPNVPCFANTTAAPYGNDAKEIRRTLVAQLVSPVLWTQSMSALVAQGFRTFIEVGPGRVLSGLLKDVSRELTVLNVQDSDSLAKLKTAYKPA